VPPAPTEASARPGGREAPAEGGAGAGRGLWAPSWPGVNVALWQGRWPLPWQRRWWFGVCRSVPLRAGTGNACVSPARARRCHEDPCHPHQQRSAPDPAGEKRPPRAGRALAGGFGPPAGQGSAWRCGRGDGPCHGNGGSAFVWAGGNRKRTAFPRPCETVPRRSAGPGAPQASARRGRGGRWPGALGPRLAWGQRGSVAGAMAPAIAAGLVVRTLTFRPKSGRNPETHAFPPPARSAATRTRARAIA
jgi:hypothetical protein